MVKYRERWKQKKYDNPLSKLNSIYNPLIIDIYTKIQSSFFKEYKNTNNCRPIQVNKPKLKPFVKKENELKKH